MKASDYLSGSVDPVIRPLLQLCIEEKPADFQAWLLDKLKGGDGSAGMALSGGGGSGPKGRGKAKRRNSIDLSHKESGRRNSLEYRITTVKDDDEEAVISLWNDAPLYSTDDTTGARNGLFNFVNEIPKYTRKKYELATDERGNPIKQDEKKGVLREFKRGDMMFNYGFFPRTWEDPDYVHPDTMAAGDNDPLDVCEVGLRQIPTGSVREVKVLGILAMIDEGETDWKVVVIDSEDPWAGMMNDISDLDKHVPGTTHMIREWFRLYKVPDGKPENKFGLDERFEDQRYAKMIIEETHQAWKELSKKDEGESKLILKRRPSMRKLGELGVRRVSSVGVSLIDGTAAPMPAQPVKPEGKPSARTGRRKSITNAIAPKTTGVEGTHEYRLQTYKENDLGAAVSLWHDIPLYVEDSAGKMLMNFICEIPKWTRRKYELATNEDSNPIKQDEKKGVLREFKRGDLAFNYGFFPRTWEDPEHVDHRTGCNGDNDPIDVCEVGLRQIPTGKFAEVKVLGILAMIDEGETDWKVVAIDATDPWAPMLNNVEQLEDFLPGTCHAIREWFRLYKVPDGKPENKFGLDEKFMGPEYALEVISETNQHWKRMMKEHSSGTKRRLSLTHRPSLAGGGGGIEDAMLAAAAEHAGN